MMSRTSPSRRTLAVIVKTTMRIISVLIFILTTQLSFGQTSDKVKYVQLYDVFETVEDSISKKINPKNTIVYKTCENYRTYYFIKEGFHWTGYFIKNLMTDGLYGPTINDTLKNGEIITYKPYATELSVFNADTLVELLIKNQITKIQQISEDSIQAKFIRKGKKRTEFVIQSLPVASHDCNGTIIIYGQNIKSVTYRGVLIETEDMHIIPTLKIFYLTKQILIKRTRNYYR